MKLWTSIAATAVLVFLVGCAGSGGSSTGSVTTTIPAIVGTPQIEAVFVPGLSGGSALPTFADTLNIQTGERVQFQLVGYSATNQRVVLPSAEWSTGDTEGTFGTISANSGVFTASDRQSDNVVTVGTRYQGRSFVSYFKVRPRSIRLGGLVLSDATHLPVPGLEIRFYNRQGGQIGQAKTQYDGSFLAALPKPIVTSDPDTTDTITYQIFEDSVPTGFIKEFKYAPGIEAERSKVDYFNNRNSSGLPIPVSISAMDQALLDGSKQHAGIGETKVEFSLSLFPSATYETGDYYLGVPILLDTAATL